LEFEKIVDGDYSKQFFKLYLLDYVKFSSGKDGDVANKSASASSSSSKKSSRPLSADEDDFDEFVSGGSDDESDE
jgi:hypothetical protein